MDVNRILSHTAGNNTESSGTVSASNRIFTLANVISFVRLCMVPIYMILLFNGRDIAACVLFAVAAATDFLDGQVARRTHCVSKLGQLMDPAIDTLLMITGVIGTCAIGRLPVWIAIVVFAREAFLLIAGAILLQKYQIRIPVVYPGKFATTFLFIGIAGLLLGTPLLQGLGICEISWLPGFNSAPACWAIWSVYIGLALQIGVTIYYCIAAYGKLVEKLKKDRSK
jgi:cardiolipin synthase